VKTTPRLVAYGVLYSLVSVLAIVLLSSLPAAPGVQPPPDYGYSLVRLISQLVFIGFYAGLALTSILMALYLRDNLFALNAMAMLFFLTFQSLNLPISQHATLLLASNTYTQALFEESFFFCHMAFVTAFYRLYKHYPITFTAIWLLQFVDLVWVLEKLSHPNMDSRGYGVIAVVVTWCCPVLFVSIHKIIQGDKAARLFMLGYLGFVVGQFSNALSFAHLVPATFAHYAFLWGIAFDGALFQCALAERVRLDRVERREAQQAHAAAQTSLLRLQEETLEVLREHNTAFARFVPTEFLQEMGRSDIVNVELGDHVLREMSVMFSDIRSFTELSNRMTTGETFDFLNTYLRRIGPVVRLHEGFIDKYLGDGVMALFSRSPGNALDAAVAMQREIRVFNESRVQAGAAPIAAGIGIHFGSVMLGTIGENERFDTTVISEVVNIASRLEGLTKLFRTPILVSGSVLALAEAHRYQVRSLGAVVVQGAARPIDVFEIYDGDRQEELEAKLRHAPAFEEAHKRYRAGDFAAAGADFETIYAACPFDGPARFFRDDCVRMSNRTDTFEWDGVSRFDEK